VDAWVAKHMVNAPERSPEWTDEVAAIYAAGRAEAQAKERAESAALEFIDGPHDQCPCVRPVHSHRSEPLEGG
jgi:hypothetical protein